MARVDISLHLGKLGSENPSGLGSVLIVSPEGSPLKKNRVLQLISECFFFPPRVGSTRGFFSY